MPVLEHALGRACVLPARRVSRMRECLTRFPGVKDLFIDGTERVTQRPANSRNRHRRYSGKKKALTRKNLIATDEQKRILLLSPTKNGRRHDTWRAEQTGWLTSIPPTTTLWVDTGFRGIDKQTQTGVGIMRPQKNTKRCPLSPAQKENNRVISALRMVCEHSLAGIKRFGALFFPSRNRKGQDDRFMSIAAGLWNFHLNFAA
jgi:DDE superfamily endonuclease